MFRLRSKKRIVLYFSPLTTCLRVGPGATDVILAHEQIPSEIKKELVEAKPYREGRPLRIEMIDLNLLAPVKEIIKIRMDH